MTNPQPRSLQLSRHQPSPPGGLPPGCLSPGRPSPGQPATKPLSVCDPSQPDLEEYLDILRHLIREPSVVGSEDAFFRIVRRELEEVDIELASYKGVLVARGRDPDSLYLSAHVDRHGLICTGPNEFQYAAFTTNNHSDLTGDSVSEQMIETIKDRFHGQRVQAHIPYVGTYLGQGTITRSFVCPHRRNLLFEVDGLEQLQPGTTVAFLDRLTISDGYISAQLDNVVSVAVLIYLFRRGFQGTGLFTAEEEAGRSWRHSLAWFRREQKTTRRLLVLDTSPYPTTAAAEDQDIVLRTKDASGVFCPQMTAELERLCDRLAIRYSHKDRYVEQLNQTRPRPLSLGRTELGRLIAATDGQITGTTLQIPTTGYHTANETAALQSISSILRLFDALA